MVVFWHTLGSCIGGTLSRLVPDIIRSLFQNKRGALSQLEDAWLEIHAKGGNGDFAIGEFSWSSDTKSYKYDGTRFTQGGKPLYHWTSNSLYVHNGTVKLIVYVYHVATPTEPNDQDYGFGLNHFSEEKTGSCRFTTGLFSDPKNTQRVHINLFRIREKLDKGLDFTQRGPKARIDLGPHCVEIAKMLIDQLPG
jgi:hypothetical protein